VFLSSPLFGRFLISVPYLNYGGILADSEEALIGLRDEAIARARLLQAAHIELRQLSPVDLGWRSTDRKLSMRLALPADYETLWKNFPSKLRSQVRRAQKERMCVRFGGLECMDDFYVVFSRCMRDLGTPVYGKQFFQAILSAFKDEARICVVSLDGVPVAAGFLYGFRHTIEIPWAASDKRYNKLAPNMLLYSAVLESACSQGYRVFDFGRSSPDSGTYRFKEQWGAKPAPMPWYYWLAQGGELPQLNPQNPKYRMAIGLWRRLPLCVANRVGPSIVKFLP
jgi:FemAB-related protein (PEP-CTERM system-associated)